MKKDIEKDRDERKKIKAPGVTIDPSLNKFQGKVLFPKKLALAEEQIKGLKLPDVRKPQK